ncbi:MAG: zinc-ribbon domain-containing protein [Verrucomicrobiae bacterium]|nr:zinc-ribbon domain-containing protein [Verrucomicrobiae bacterium]
MGTPESCPNCGADVPDGAKACPECGSDESTGWSEQARYDSVGLPDDQFDYEDFVRREFEANGVKPRGISWFWWVVAAIILVVFVAFVFGIG